MQNLPSRKKNKTPKKTPIALKHGTNAHPMP
jgi:hypothetical protein